MPELNDRDWYKNRVKKHQERRQEKSTVKISEEDREKRKMTKSFWGKRKNQTILLVIRGHTEAFTKKEEIISFSRRYEEKNIFLPNALPWHKKPVRPE